MGEYDSNIVKLRNDVNSLNSDIQKCKNDIAELEGMMKKSDDISREVDVAVNTIFTNIDKKSVSLPGNFASYYKNNISRIMNDNGIREVSGMVISDKNRMKERILDLEDRIRQLQSQISSKQGDISFFQSLNVETEV